MLKSGQRPGMAGQVTKGARGQEKEFRCLRKVFGDEI